MNLSQNPERICIWLNVPAKEAEAFSGVGARTVESRHILEKIIQEYFFGMNLAAIVETGGGSLSDGSISILTDAPVAAIQTLWTALVDACDRNKTDIFDYLHIGWFDRDDVIWRAFWPLTTRPLWTLMEDPAKIRALMEKGKKSKG